jgi:hypothetical protein
VTAVTETSNDRWVVVHRYIDLTEARLAADGLEDAGIRTRVEGESDALHAAGGNVKLLVQANDAERATAALDADALAEAPDDPHDTSPRCTACDSIYVIERFSEAQIFIAIMGFGLPLLFLKRSRLCAQCGTQYDPKLLSARDAYRSPMVREGNPVFQLRQSRAGEGAFLGFLAGALVSQLIHSVPIGMFAGPIAGYLIGGGIGRDVCSNPKCRKKLDPGDKTCARCGGSVKGRIKRAREHFIRKAEWRRGIEKIDE